MLCSPLKHPPTNHRDLFTMRASRTGNNQSPLRRPRPFGVTRGTHKNSKVTVVPSTAPVDKKKAVSFAKGKDTTFVLPDDSDFRSLIWLSAEEMYQTKADATQLAEALETMGLVHGNHEEWRGLESRGPEGKWAAYKARLDVVNAVLDGQDARLDAILLAKASRELTVACVNEAIGRAEKDAMHAKEHHKGVQKTTTTTSKTQRCKTHRGRRPLFHTQVAPTSDTVEQQQQHKQSNEGNRRRSVQTKSQKTRIIRVACEINLHSQRS